MLAGSRNVAYLIGVGYRLEASEPGTPKGINDFMYVPKPFGEDRPEALQDLIRTSPFGTFVTMTTDGPEASHIPFVLKLEPPPFGGGAHLPTGASTPGAVVRIGRAT